MAVGVTHLERVLPGVRAWVLVSALLLPGREPWARPLCLVFLVEKKRGWTWCLEGPANWDIPKQPWRSRIRDPPGHLCYAPGPWCPWALGRASQATGLWPHAGVLQRVLGHISLEVHVGVRSRNLEVPHEGF